MISNIIILFWAHFIGDFLFQTTYMSFNKSKDIKALLWHCLVYSIPLLIFGWKFAFLGGFLHFPIDYVTSKATAYLWEKKKVKWFFTVIGFDQAIHMSILVFILKFMSII